MRPQRANARTRRRGIYQLPGDPIRIALRSVRPASVAEVTLAARRQEPYQIPRAGQSPSEAALAAAETTVILHRLGMRTDRRRVEYLYALVPASWIRPNAAHVRAERTERQAALGCSRDPIFILHTVEPYDDPNLYLEPFNGNNRAACALRTGASHVAAYVSKKAWEDVLDARVEHGL